MMCDTAPLTGCSRVPLSCKPALLVRTILSSSSFVLALVLLTASLTPAQGQIVLEDFASMRLSGQSGNPYMYLWHGMLNQGPTNCSISNNTLVCTTAGSASNGLGWWFNSLNCDTTACYSDPQSYVKGRIKSGTWNPNVNRLRFTYKCNTNIAAAGGGNYWLTIGTYVRDPQEPTPSQSGQGSHHYHFINQPSVANEWVNVELNRVTQYRIGESGDTRLPEDSEWYSPAQTKPVHYYDGLTHFYFGPTYASELRAAGVTCSTGAYTLDTVTGGADAYVSNIAGSYNPTTGRYDLSWNQPKNTPGGAIFEIRYANRSLRSSGWSTGTSGNTAGPGQSNSPYSTINYSSPAVSRQSAMYFGIRPKMRVITASVSGAIRLKTHAEHFLSTGDPVLVEGVCAGANGARTVTVVDKETVSLDGTSGSCSLTSGSATLTATSETKNFAEFVVGAGASTPAPVSIFDVNGDGVVNSTDVDITIQAALGTSTCGSADVSQDGRCDVIDVQRVINASR